MVCNIALLSHFTSSEVRFLDLVFLRGAGCPGNPRYGGQARLGNRHHAEKLSPKIALHLKWSAKVKQRYLWEHFSFNLERNCFFKNKNFIFHFWMSPILLWRLNVWPKMAPLWLIWLFYVAFLMHLWNHCYIHEYFWRHALQRTKTYFFFNGCLKLSFRILSSEEKEVRCHCHFYTFV